MVERHATLEQRLDFLEQAIGRDLKDKPPNKRLEQVIPRCSMLVRIFTYIFPLKIWPFLTPRFFQSSIHMEATGIPQKWPTWFFGINSEITRNPTPLKQGIPNHQSPITCQPLKQDLSPDEKAEATPHSITWNNCRRIKCLGWRWSLGDGGWKKGFCILGCPRKLANG